MFFIGKINELIHAEDVSGVINSAVIGFNRETSENRVFCRVFSEAAPFRISMRRGKPKAMDRPKVQGSRFKVSGNLLRVSPAPQFCRPHDRKGGLLVGGNIFASEFFPIFQTERGAVLPSFRARFTFQSHRLHPPRTPEPGKSSISREGEWRAR